jgi:hypothetical protein
MCILVKSEIADIYNNLDEKTASWSTALSLKYRRHFLIGLTLCVAQQLTGINAVIYYVQPILRSSGLTDSSTTNGVSAGVMFWNFLTTILAIK